MSYTLIQTATLGSAQSSIVLSSIPQTFTDLKLLMSLRASNATDWLALRIRYNSNASGYTQRILYSANGGVFSMTRSDDFALYIHAANATANTFCNAEATIPNYRGSSNKSFSVDWVNERNSTTHIAGITAGLWSNTSAITSIDLIIESGNMDAGSSVSLYGVTSGSSGGVVVS